MKAGENNLLQFMDGHDKRFFIPVYQRPYSWKKANCQQLLKDLRDVYINKYQNHFFGSIVYIDDDNGRVREYTIIDGQQRITTVCILLLAIRNYIINNKKKDEIDINVDKILRAYLTDEYANDDKKLKLKLVQGDNQAYDNLIFNKSITGNNMLTLNYQFFYDEISKMKSNEISYLYDSITKLMIVGINLKLSDGDDPQLIFESLNSTGLELEEADKIRNYILMGLEQKKQDKIYNTYWIEIEKATGKSEINKFIRHYIAIKTRTLPAEDKLYFEFKKLSNTVNNIEELLKDMLKCAQFYSLIKKCDYNEKGYKGSIGRMLYLGISTVIPLLFDLYYAQEQELMDEEDMDVAVSLIETYYVRRCICNLPTASINKTFVSIGAEVDEYIDNHDVTYLEALKHSLFIRKGKTRYPNNSEFEENFKSFELYNAKSEFRKYVFERLENTNIKERIAIFEQLNNGELTIEHIMPQTLTNEWKNDLGENWELIYEKYLDTIGNLTLSAYNSDYSNYSFLKKKELSEKGFNFSKLYLNDYIKNCIKWGEQQIIDRAELLSKKALEIWSKLDYVENDILEERDIDLDEEFDYTNKIIKKMRFRGSEIVTKDMTDAYIKINEILYNEAPDNFCLMSTSHHSNVKDNLRRGYKLSDSMYIELHLNNQAKIRDIRELLKINNISTDELVFTVSNIETKEFKIEDEKTYSSLTVGKLAYNLIKNLLENNKITKEEIEKLVGTEYSRSTFSKIVYPVIAYKKNANMGNSKHIRYYKDPVFVNNCIYYISSQWFDESKEDLIRWYKNHLI